MTKYTVDITRPAEFDLSGIYSYIVDTLKEPRTAQRVYTSIKQEILALSTMPERHPIIDEMPFAEYGVRRLLIEGYVAFYTVDKVSRKVNVLRVLYNRREWQSILGAKEDTST